MFAPIKDYEGIYEINEVGKIRRIDRNYFLKPMLGKNGYFMVCLWKQNTPGYRYIHRILAEAFLPNPKSLPTVNHIDGNKGNNDLSNLEWASYSRNNKHAYETGLKNPSRNTGPKKPVIQLDINGIKISEFVSAIEAAKKTGISTTTVYRILHGKRKSSRGFIFKYKEEIVHG